MIEDSDGVALSRGAMLLLEGGGADLRSAYGQVTGDRAGSLSWPTAPTRRTRALARPFSRSANRFCARISLHHRCRSEPLDGRRPPDPAPASRNGPPGPRLPTRIGPEKHTLGLRFASSR